MYPILRRTTVTAALLSALTGCALFNHIGDDSPRALTAVAPMEPRPRVALVLSSGGPRGYARSTGEHSARQQLPQLLSRLQQAGLWVELPTN